MEQKEKEKFLRKLSDNNIFESDVNNKYFYEITDDDVEAMKKLEQLLIDSEFIERTSGTSYIALETYQIKHPDGTYTYIKKGTELKDADYIWFIREEVRRNGT